MSNKTYLPKRANWFRLPEYIRNIFEASVDNTAESLLALDAEGNPVTVDKSSLGGGGGLSIAASGLYVATVADDLETTVDIPHGLGVTPDKGDVLLTWGNAFTESGLGIVFTDATIIRVQTPLGFITGDEVYWKILG